MGVSSSKLYVPLSAGARFDHRVLNAGPEAELLFYRLLQLAKQDERDGVLHEAQILREAPWAKTASKAMAALVREELLRRVDGDGRQYQLAGWLDWNDSKQTLEERRRAERERKRRARTGGRGGDNPDPSGDRPGGVRPDTGGTPDGIRRESGTESRAQDRTGQDSSDVGTSVGTSTVAAPDGSDPSPDPTRRPAWLRSVS